MTSKSVLFITLVICFLTLSMAADTFDCKWKAGGKTLDLTSFEGKILPGKNEFASGWSMALCGNADQVCGNADISICSGSGLGGNSYASNSLDPEPEVKVLKPVDSDDEEAEGKKGGFQMIYKNVKSGACPDAFTTTVDLYCADEASEFFMAESNIGPCIINIKYSNPLFCVSGGGDSSGLSGGAIFLIVVFSVLAAYFIVGFLICKFKFKTAGFVESIPQNRFWCALPGLFIAGISCTFAFFRSKCGGKGSASGSGDYESYGAVEEV